MTTQQTLSKNQLKALNPCDLEQRLKLFGTKEKLTIKEAFEAGFTVSDICWLMGALKKCVEIVKFADFCKGQAASYAASYAASDAAYYASRAAYCASRAAYYPSRAAYCASLAAYCASLAASDASDASDAAQKEFLIKLLS